MKKGAIGYARVSSKDRNKNRSASLGNQGDNITLWCREVVNRELFGIFEDDGYSAKTFDRPDWKKLEVFIKEHHKDIDLLVVDTFDRFSRNLVEGLEMMKRLESKFSITVVSATEPINAHPDHPDYFTQRAKYLLDAETERHKIKFRTGRGVWKANKEGRHIGFAPWGYLKIDGMLHPEPKTSPFVIEAFRMFLAGSEKTQIMAYLRSKGYPKQGKVAINRILENPVYAGMVRVKAFYGQKSYLAKGVHKGIISEAMYYRAEEILKAKNFTRLKLNADVPLRGVLLCHCGKKLTAGNSKGKKQYVWYYKCNEHKKENIPAKKIHAQLCEIMTGLNLPDLYIETIRERLTAGLNSMAGNQRQELEQKQRELDDLNRKLESIEQKYIDDGLDKEAYHRNRDRYTKDRTLLAAEIAEALTPVNETFVKVEHQMAQLANMGYLYEIANTIQKQTLISWVFNSRLSWSNGVYRTPSVEPIFRPNAMKLNKKGLLILEQPIDKSSVSNACSARGTTVEPLISLLTLISEITAA